MRAIPAAALVCMVLAAAATPAHGLTYASGVTLDSSAGASVGSISHSAAGTSETDNKTAKFKQQFLVSVINVTYSFPTTTVESGTHKAYFVVDGNVTGTVTARVTAINGNSVSGTASTTIAGSGLSDKLFATTYSVSSTTAISSVSFQVLLVDLNRKAELQVDAVALPEPGTWLLFGLGAGGLTIWRRRRRPFRVPDRGRIRT